MNDFRETLYTVDKQGNRKWVYPHEQNGLFRSLRRLAVVPLLLFYLLMPWFSIGGQQAIWLDIVHRRFVFFGVTFWATDTRFLFLLLISLALSLFFFTALLGRVWCGWACPETVFLEFVFRPIERFLEGNAQARRKLDQSEWNFRKIRIKLTKFVIFSLLAWVLASTFLAYFIGRETLIRMMLDYPWNNWQPFLLTLGMMGLMLFQFGWFREQFCTLVCPYARFQSVLLDDSSLLVAYDGKRGEPRGKAGDTSRGDCIDCGLCVRVCPTGIDIRNGLQLECVQCAACADACNSVMVKIGRRPGLVRYATERGLAGNPVRILRPRVLVYAAALIGIAVAWTYFLSQRQESEVSVFHSSKDSLFTVMTEGKISNHLELSLSNKSNTIRKFSIAVSEMPQVSALLPISPYPIAGGDAQRVPAFVTFPADILVNGKAPVTLVVSDDLGFEQKFTVELLGPG